MKTLQNNFTTPEQSKRLLELGLPADSADMFWSATYLNGKKDGYLCVPSVISHWSGDFSGGLNDTDSLPCWSVGRLIEIYLTCALEYHPYDDFYTETPSLHLMAFDKDRLIEEVIEIMSEDKMDFSKLED